MLRLSERKRSVSFYPVAVYIEARVGGGVSGGVRNDLLLLIYQDIWPDLQMKPGLSGQGPCICDLFIFLKFKKNLIKKLLEMCFFKKIKKVKQYRNAQRRK